MTIKNIDSLRNKLLFFIHSTAVGGTTTQLGQPTPYLDYVEEFLCMWFDDYYRDPAQLIIDGVLSKPEAVILDRFSAAVSDSYPKNIELSVVDTNKLQNDRRWQFVVQAAKEAEEALNNLDKKIEAQHRAAPDANSGRG